MSSSLIECSLFITFMKFNLIDLLVRIKNFSILLRNQVNIKKNVNYKPILYVLYKNGLIQSFLETSNIFTIFVRYYFNKPVICYLKIFSKPSLVTYISLIEIYKLPTKKFLFFFSTSRGGIFNQFDCKRHKLGGKLLFVC